jgi:hypothetical protein
MSDDRSTTDKAGGATTISRPPARTGLLRSLAHRLVGDDAELPVEGHLPSFDGATRWLKLGAVDGPGTPRARGPG